VAGARFSISRTFSEWAERHNLPAVRASVTVASWVWTGLLGAGIVLLAGKAPHVRDFFELRTEPALVVLAILCATSIAGVLLTRTAPPGTRAAITIFGNALTMWFVASLVTLSSARGATVFALLPVFVAAYHGYLLRGAPRYPFVVLSTVLGIAGAVALDARHAALFELVTPLAIGVSLTLGSVALRTDELNAERDKLRAAVDAQALEAKSQEAQRLSTALLEVLGHNHDIGNTLAAARVNADWLHRETQEGIAPPAADLHTMADELRGSLERLARILGESKHIGQQMGPAAALQEVNVTSCIAHTVETFDARLRGIIRRELEISSNAHALVRGGVTNFERVLENLLRNAVEGDGERGASQIVVRAKDEPTGFMTIEIADDGPGFPQESLRQAIGAFGTTKRDGTGLGLYTTERLVVASGGQLLRANRPEGGAVVRVVLAKGGIA